MDNEAISDSGFFLLKIISKAYNLLENMAVFNYLSYWAPQFIIKVKRATKLPHEVATPRWWNNYCQQQENKISLEVVLARSKWYVNEQIKHLMSMMLESHWLEKVDKFNPHSDYQMINKK